MENLRNADEATAREILKNEYPENIAALLNSQEGFDIVALFKNLDSLKAIKTFEHLHFEKQQEILLKLPFGKITAVLNDISPDDRTRLFQRMPADQVKKWLGYLSLDERKVAKQLLEYPRESIGRLMTPEFISVRPHWTVEKTLAHVRKHGKDSETLNVIYVVDQQGKLVDDFRIREILLAPLKSKMSDLMDSQFVHLNAYEDQETAIRVFKDTDRFALPVTDFGGILVGIVTSDDLLDVIEEEDTEDIHKFGGSEALEDEYFKISLPKMIRKRGGWLVILFLGEMLTATAMTYFEDEIAKAVVLALFVPLIISSGGNTGSQAATIIIRALALGEVTITDWWQVMRREILSGLALGCLLGIIGFLRIAVWNAFSGMYGEHWLPIAFTVGTSLIGVVMWGTISGSMLPLLLKKVGFDPAASSAPFVATLVDVTGVLIYFGLAALFLTGTLL